MIRSVAVRRVAWCLSAAALTAVAALAAAAGASPASAQWGEPALLVYPDAPAVFRFDPSRYRLLTAADSAFDAAFAIGGVMLWDEVEHRIPREVYRAPYLTGFEPSSEGRNEFVAMANDVDIIVDGYHEHPRQLGNLYIRFIPDPPESNARVILDGILLDRWIAPIAGLVVATPTPDGHFSGTRRLQVSWSLATGMRITVYADKDGDRVYDGVPRFGVYLQDGTVPVEHDTWGGIKARFQ